MTYIKFQPVNLSANKKGQTTIAVCPLQKRKNIMPKKAGLSCNSLLPKNEQVAAVVK